MTEVLLRTGINPEAIGVFGLAVTVTMFGLEQLGIGITKDSDMTAVTKSISYISIIFGGATQIFTAFCMYVFNAGGAHSIFFGTVFGFFGCFWVMVGCFFLNGGDKKVFAHFFAVSWLLVLAFLIYACKNLPFATRWYVHIIFVLVLILLFVLIPSWYGSKCKAWGIIGGIANLLIALFAIPLFMQALGVPLF